ncbi:MAG: DUF2203 domain-containing protein [Solirubrobacteraceae bacterium]
MRHTRHYTLAEANAARPWVVERVRRIRAARAALAGLGSRAADGLATLNPQAGGAYPGRELALPLVALSRAADELQAVEIVLRDAQRGLVDFPAIRDGAEVYLCWLLDEAEIRFWHAPEAGFSGRQPL